MDTPHITDWTFKHDYIPSRKGAYFAIEQGDMSIHATVKEWLNESLQKTTKKKASYMLARRWSYDNGNRENHPQWFAIKIN